MAGETGLTGPLVTGYTQLQQQPRLNILRLDRRSGDAYIQTKAGSCVYSSVTNPAISVTVGRYAKGLVASQLGVPRASASKGTHSGFFNRAVSIC